MHVVAAYKALRMMPAPDPYAMRCLCTSYVDDWQVTLLGKKACVAKGNDKLKGHMVRLEDLGLAANRGKLAIISGCRRLALVAATKVTPPPRLARGMYKGRIWWHVSHLSMRVDGAAQGQFSRNECCVQTEGWCDLRGCAGQRAEASTSYTPLAFAHAPGTVQPSTVHRPPRWSASGV